MSPRVTGIRRNLLLLSSALASCSVYDHTLIDAAMPELRDARTDSNTPDASLPPPLDAGHDAAEHPTNGDAGAQDESDGGAVHPVAGSGGRASAGASGQSSSGAGAGGSGGRAGSAAPEPACGPKGTGRLSSDGHCYFVLAETLTWTVARDNCQNAGAQLASITSQAEHDLALDLLDSKACWIGLARFGSATFTWITAESLVFTAWKSGAPSQSGERGVLLDPGPDAWVDASPGELHCAICEQAAAAL